MKKEKDRAEVKMEKKRFFHACVENKTPSEYVNMGRISVINRICVGCGCGKICCVCVPWRNTEI